MPRFSLPLLERLLDEHPSLLESAPEWAALSDEARIALYDRVYPQLEARLWQAGTGAFAHRLARLQALYREQQALIDHSGRRTRHHFLIGIPVADRPAHLRACLESLLQQCRLYGYGGRDAGGRYAGFTVVVSEDSRDPACVAAHRALAEEYGSLGLTVVHFDLPEQAALLQAIPPALRDRLGRLLTTQPPERFWHKGQAANRNLCLLRMRELAPRDTSPLYYLVDSDQSFLVTRQGASGEEAVPALNYFHWIDRIFSTHGVRVLTGKLVGDPPVSPAVMAVNFLDDVLAFLERISACDPRAACSFHGQAAPAAGDAAYHDLAKWFGFAVPPAAVEYRCPIRGAHDHAACLEGFAARLRGFFFGEHLTRRTGFRYDGPPTMLTPARTIYPGNTIVDAEGLRYLIPFGHLRLRMSGPTAGRLIQAEIGARFVSANLPMLHRRTASAGQAGEFRPGVETNDDDALDIGDEFERQFFGDLMLFSVEAWLKRHALDPLDDETAVADTVRQVEAGLLEQYTANRHAVNVRLAELERRIGALPDASATVRARLTRFARDLAANFGNDAPVWRKISSADHRARRRAEIVDALLHYREERTAWDRLVTGGALRSRDHSQA